MVHGWGAIHIALRQLTQTWKLRHFDVIDDVIRDRETETTSRHEISELSNGKTASLYDNFCKTGNDVIDDVITQKR